MKSATLLAFISGLLLALFIVIRPVIGRIGSPTPPETGGGGQTDTTSTGVPSGIPSASSLPGRAGVTHLDTVEDLLFLFTDQARKDEGWPSLNNESALRDIAREHSTDMIARAFFSHENPDGNSPNDRVALNHRQLIGVGGENIYRMQRGGRSDREVAEKIILDWLNSPGHRANILRPEYTHIGIGVSTKGDEIRVTQNFATIRAFLDLPMPEEIRSGDRLPLALTLFPQTAPAPTLYDYWFADQGLPAGDPIPITDNIVNIAPGVYKLRFYFPGAGGVSLIYMGPRLEVKNP